jgi:hypothetical protein
MVILSVNMSLKTRGKQLEDTRVSSSLQKLPHTGKQRHWLPTKIYPKGIIYHLKLRDEMLKVK